MASSYNIVASTNQSTVVSEYIPDSKRSDSYQTEAELEQEFIRLLSTLGYEYLTIKDEQSSLYCFNSENSSSVFIAFCI